MHRKSININNLVIFCLLYIFYEILYFLLTPYYKGILTPLATNHTYSLIGQIVLRVILYLIYFILTYICIFSVIKGKVYNEKDSKILIIFIKLLILRATYDILIVLLKSPNNQTLIIDYLICAIELSFVFFNIYIISCFCLNQTNFIKLDKFTIFFSIINFILLFVLCVIFYNMHLKNLYIKEKYISTSNLVINHFRNISFQIELLQLITFSIFSVLYILYFSFMVYKHNGYTHKKYKIEKNKLMVRIFTSIIALAFLYYTKLLIYPIGSLSVFPDISGSYMQTADFLKSFDENKTDFTISRFNSYGLNKTIVINKKFIDIKYHNTSVLSFYSNFTDEDNSPENCKNKLYAVDTEYTNYYYNSYSADIMRYSTEAIVFLDKDIPYGVKNKNIDKHSENEILTATIKKLISDGYWDYFEYGYEYMLKYDPEFIKPYIKRYSNGIFTDTELKINNYINKSFIIDFSKRVSRTHFV